MFCFAAFKNLLDFIVGAFPHDKAAVPFPCLAAEASLALTTYGGAFHAKRVFLFGSNSFPQQSRFNSNA
jgi:hypothetical protein